MPTASVGAFQSSSTLRAVHSARPASRAARSTFDACYAKLRLSLDRLPPGGEEEEEGAASSSGAGVVVSLVVRRPELGGVTELEPHVPYSKEAWSEARL